MSEDGDKVVSFQSRLTAEQAYGKGTKRPFEYEEICLGPWTSYTLINDAKHLAFTLSRYKFAAKMLEEKKSVLEVGCGDGFGLPLLAQVAAMVYSVDWDNRLIEGNKRRLAEIPNIKHMCVNLNEEDIPLANIDAAVSIDVIEHLDPQKEDEFMRRLLKTLHRDAVLILGTPNITAASYASGPSRAMHINLKSHESLRKLIKKYCTHVFSFGMNDENIHCGFGPMCHYLFAIGVGIKGKYLM